MSPATVTFTIRRHLLEAFLTRMEKLDLNRALFGFRYFTTDPWPAEPVRAWSLAAYMDDEDEAPYFTDSIPVIQAVGGGDDDERTGVISYRYGLLRAIRELWESNPLSGELLDLSVRVREDISYNTLEPIRLETNTTLRRPI